MQAPGTSPIELQEEGLALFSEDFQISNREDQVPNSLQFSPLHYVTMTMRCLIVSVVSLASSAATRLFHIALFLTHILETYK